MLHAAILVFSDHRFLIWPAMGIAAGIFGSIQGFSRLQRRRLILNTPASKIRSVSTGLVEISGLATGPHVITSPLKQIECYYYSAAVWEWRQPGKHGDWIKIADESLHVPFYVDDDTDKLLIDPRGADMDLHCDFRDEYKRSSNWSDDEIPARVKELLARYGATAHDKAIRVEERCIKPDDFLFVLGTLSQNPGLDMSLAPACAARGVQGNGNTENAKQEAVAEVIRLSADAARLPVTEMSQQQKIAAALAKSGSLAIHTWPLQNASTNSVSNSNCEADVSPKSVSGSSTPLATSCAPAATEVAEKRIVSASTGFDLHPPVVLMKGSDEPTFFISWRSQRGLVTSLDWKSQLPMWGSPALVLACIYLLVIHLR